MNTLLSLLHIADSSYPTGAFGHSWGLESAISLGWVGSYTALFDWASEALEYSLIPLDVAVIQRVQLFTLENDLNKIIETDRELVLYRPSQVLRESQAQVGRSMIDISADTFAKPLILEIKGLCQEMLWKDFIQFPAAWSVVCTELGISLEDNILSYLHAAVRQMAQVAIRLIPIGQKQASQLIAKLSQSLESMHPLTLKTEFMSVSPGMDMAGMYHESMKARYFRS